MTTLASLEGLWAIKPPPKRDSWAIQNEIAIEKQTFARYLFGLVSSLLNVFNNKFLNIGSDTTRA